LEDCTRERYGALDQMSSKLRQLQEQRDALDTLVEALRTDDGWLAYRAEALLDQLLELEGQSTEGASAVEKVHTMLVDRDEALRRWSLLTPSSSGTAQPLREHGPGRVRPRRGPRRLRS
jgi:hypothetical protein